MAAPAPIRTADMDPMDVADLLRKKMMKAKLSRDQVNKLIPPSLKNKDQCEGEGSIYTKALVHSTKKVIEDRKANQDIYTSGVARAVYGEVELVNYGPSLLEANREEKRRREANKEVFTPDIHRAIFNKEENPIYAKCIVESHQKERARQEANKGAHSGGISRNIYGDASGTTAETVNPCSQCPKCVQERNLKEKALQKEAYLRADHERQQRFLEQKQQKEAARLEAIAQHEKYQKQVEEFNADPRIRKMCDSQITGV